MWDHRNRRNVVPRRPTNVGGRRLKEATASLRDSSLEERKAPRVIIPDEKGSTRPHSIWDETAPGQAK